MSKVALITGVNGQDGSYLAEFLLDKNYEVIGVVRRSSTNTSERLLNVKDNKNFKLVEGDITDPSSICELVSKYKPDEFYGLAAQSHVGTSFNQPTYTFEVDAVGVLNCLEAIRIHSPTTKYYQASTSELFGSNYDTLYGRLKHNQELLISYNDPECDRKFQDEDTPFSPNSPYAVAKLAAHNLVRVYRDSYHIHASAGILFNHESERRGENFVTRKITKYIAGLKEHTLFDLFKDGQYELIQGEDQLCLGNIDSYRDWGYAPDFVEAMWLMLQQEKPDDYVIATGKTYTIRYLLDIAFKYIGINNWEPFVFIDTLLFRPNDVDYLCGKSDKAQKVLGWKPKTSFEDMIHKMIDSDYAKLQ